ncbi:MAG: Bro-N domain-containing protein [Kiritimatiellia bacterium]
MNKAENQLRLFEESPIQYIERDGDPWFSSEEIGRQLEYSEPRKSINLLYQKNADEIKQYSTVIKTMTVDGRSREMRVFSEEGIYILTMLARTPKAKEFRSRVARLLRDMRKHRLELARQAGQMEALGAVSQLTESQYGILPHALRYRDMGLNSVEISKLLGCSKDIVRRALRPFKGVAA